MKSEERKQSMTICAGKYWMRAYHRDDKTCYLCNFCPTGANGVLTKLERLLDIEEVALFQDVDMAFIVTNKKPGIPVYDLSEVLTHIHI